MVQWNGLGLQGWMQWNPGACMAQGRDCTHISSQLRGQWHYISSLNQVW